MKIRDAIELTRQDKGSLKLIIMACCAFFALVGFSCVLGGFYISMAMVRFPTWGESAPGTAITTGIWILVWSVVGILGASGESLGKIGMVRSVPRRPPPFPNTHTFVCFVSRTRTLPPPLRTTITTSSVL